MTRGQAVCLLGRLVFGNYVAASDVSSWLLDSKVYFDRPASSMSLSDAELQPQNFVQETNDEQEQYNYVVKQFCYAIGNLWDVDRHTSRVIVERLLSLLTWTYTGMDCDIIRGKLSVLRLLSEI